MGIKQLAQLLAENCQKGIRTRNISYFINKKVGIDASNFIYQFLTAVRSDGANLGTGNECTSHLVGLFYRTIRFVEKGITPVYVFDGKPPEMKIYELSKRFAKREKAEEDHKKAEIIGDKKEIEKYAKRKVKINDKHISDSKKLLDLLGVPYITAPSEAEALCAYLCKQKFVYGVVTEDMDALTFGSPILLRNFSATSKKQSIIEYNLNDLLKELDLTMKQFIDICIILGSDYCKSMEKVGLKTCINLIKKHNSIEEIVKIRNIEDFDYKKAREIFYTLPEIELEINKNDLCIKWDQIDIEKIKDFLVTDKHFDETRVTRNIEKYLASKSKINQSVLDSFFTKKV